MDMVFKALLVLGRKQEQFKKKLTMVSGAKVCSDLNVLSCELHMYEERMKAIQKEHNDGPLRELGDGQRRALSSAPSRRWPRLTPLLLLHGRGPQEPHILLSSIARARLYTGLFFGSLTDHRPVTIVVACGTRHIYRVISLVKILHD